MKQMLCVIDGSESSRKVLEVAVKVANAFGAHLIVLFPYRLIPNGFGGDIPSLKAKIEKEAHEKFDILYASLPRMERPSVEFRPEIGFAADRIQSHLRANEVELIVVAQPSDTNTADLQDISLQRLIASSKQPFVVVPAEVSEAAV